MLCFLLFTTAKGVASDADPEVVGMAIKGTDLPAIGFARRSGSLKKSQDFF